jgi:hypothetical protein
MQNYFVRRLTTSATRAQWDEGLRAVRQFNDLLRVLPPIPAQAAAVQSARHHAEPGRPQALPTGRSDAPPVLRPQQPRTGTQAPNFQT